jgi:hypothetical protein
MEAKKSLTKKQSELDGGELTHHGKQDLNRVLDLWLETIARPRLQPRSYIDYRELMRLHVSGAIGEIRLSELRPVHIQRLYGRLQTEWHLSSRRIRYVQAVLSSALKKAVELDIIPRNAAKLVALPKDDEEGDGRARRGRVSQILNGRGRRTVANFIFRCS